MDNPVTVHDINELTVVTDESHTDVVTGLGRCKAARGLVGDGVSSVLEHMRRAWSWGIPLLSQLRCTVMRDGHWLGAAKHYLLRERRRYNLG